MTETHDQQVRRSWLNGRQLRGFALPQGRLGRLMGWVMGAGNLVEQRDVLQALNPRAGERILEVGHGPGALLELIIGSGATAAGVDPSPVMCDMARRRLSMAIGDGRAEVKPGDAESVGHPDRCFDAVVSVNNLPMWSDLGRGLRELRRVLRPGGRLVVAWHGGRRPTRIARSMALPDQVLEQVRLQMRDVFGAAERRELDHVVVFLAAR
ncbi:MAG: class I SAM-dependent methyltransferase [Micromonosporaceae bacterium]